MRALWTAFGPKRDESDFSDTTMLFINPIQCIDCGACVPVCPVSAIFAEGDLPEKWDHFMKINADHYVKRTDGVAA